VCRVSSLVGSNKCLFGLVLSTHYLIRSMKTFYPLMIEHSHS
jgi:hypothetical protein